MRTSTLGAVLLSLAIAFAFAGVLFSNLAWTIVTVALVSAFIYGQRQFLEEIRQTSLRIERQMLKDIVFTQEPFDVKVEVLNTNPMTVRGEFEDVIPTDCTLSSGSNKITHELPPRSLLTFSYVLIPQKRGPHLIPGMRIERIDSFGLFVEDQTIEQGTVVRAHTARESYEIAQKMAGREHFEFSGTVTNPAVALRQLEFEGIREYVPGDRARDIHWKVYPKLGKLMTKTYRREGSLNTTIFVDCGRSMRFKTHGIAKIDHALDLSMQLSRVLLSSYHATGVGIFDEVRVLDKIDPSLGRHQFENIVRVLKAVPSSFPASEGTNPIRTETAPELSRSEDASLNKISANERKAFLAALTTLRSTGQGAGLGVGLERAVKESVSKGRRQQQLFIVITDLISSRDSVVEAARTAKLTGNRSLVIHTYDDWYRRDKPLPEMPEIERMYDTLGTSLKMEASLRALGSSYMRVGPADSASRIVRAIRRGQA